MNLSFPAYDLSDTTESQIFQRVNICKSRDSETFHLSIQQHNGLETSHKSILCTCTRLAREQIIDKMRLFLVFQP